jgi:NDP-sugar pyrophosphorylase family protein
LKPTLLIIAAGMGSRYGGLKQIDTVGPNGEIIIDYSMYDAVKAGFEKVVFVIRHYFEGAFREKIGNKLDGIVQTAYAYQELDSYLDGFPLPADRDKPWGTGHAILVAKDVISEPFVVINADDYYGVNTYRIIKEYLSGTRGDNSDYCMVGYTLDNTLSEYGHVSRGVCQCDENMYLKSVTEIRRIIKNKREIIFTDDGRQQQTLSGDEVVSMNLWGFQPDIFKHLQKQFGEFLVEHGKEQKSEFYIPSVVDRLVASKQKKVKVLHTEDSWFGVTYKQDKEIAQKSIQHLIERGFYPHKLWK